MIGSFTLLIKKGEKYNALKIPILHMVYEAGECKRQRVSLFSFFNSFVRKRKKFNAVKLSKDELVNIVRGRHDLRGDGTYLIDYNEKKISDFEDYDFNKTKKQTVNSILKEEIEERRRNH